jgi:N-acetylglutamate synthase-like GNAT family acetyltransferase
MQPNIPVPRAEVSVRPATIADLPFIDALQKQHTKQLGWMPTNALEGKLKRGHVIIAEDEAKQGVGYCIGHDQYFKRDDVGIIYQLNVLPTKRRGLIGATLVKAMFERAAYGCRLFCCWCAQDLDANYFWESLGFVPLAFRAGAGGKRVHIFWQRRIRAGDVTTPYWFPAKTDGGMMREDRLVLPIPPGVHWKEPMPILMPEVPKAPAPRSRLEAQKKAGGSVPQLMPPTRRGARFGPPPANDVPAEPLAVEKPASTELAEVKPEKKKREKVKADPALVAKARELRDRWLERVNAPGGASVLASSGKYEVGKQLTASQPKEILQFPRAIAA